MKKIVHITNDLQRLGGVQRLLVDLMTLQKDDFQFEVILTRGENEYVDELNQLGVSVYHKRDIGLRGVIKRMNAADLVHAHLFPSLYIALLTSTPTVITEHNPHYRRRDILFIKTLESLLFRKFKKTACISNGVQNALLRDLNWSSNKTEVICNGIDLSRFSLKRKELPLENKQFKIGMVGRLHPQKDIKTLIDCIKLLDSHCELHLAGDGELRSQLESYANEIGVSDKVYFYGQVNNIPEFLESLDLYVQSSNWEGFGLAAVEAMAAGLPCLATNVEGLNDIVSKEALFNVADVEKLLALITDIKGSGELYVKMSLASLQKAQYFSAENTALMYQRFYNGNMK
ncbi:glycosyltransferase [Psychromonas sp. GE-S-Ul-11]|uniref:glycosyltransferase n=1 Tax=unclassified Psychromonas TaxID=2614957 RepID=UPI00390C4310